MFAIITESVAFVKGYFAFFSNYFISKNRAGLPYQRSAIGILVGGKHLVRFVIPDNRCGITIVATLGEGRRLFHCGEATDNLLIETARANDSLNYLKHVIVILLSIVVCYVCHYILFIVICQG